MKLPEHHLIAVLRSEEKMKAYLQQNEKEPSKIDPVVWQIHFLMPPKKQMSALNKFLDDYSLKVKRFNCFLPDHMVSAKIYKMLNIPYKISSCIKSPFKDYVKVTVSAKKSNHLSKYKRYYNVDLKSTKKSDFGIYDFNEESPAIIPFAEYRKRLKNKTKTTGIFRDTFDDLLQKRPSTIINKNAITETSISSKPDAKKHVTFDRLSSSATLKSKFESIKSVMSFNPRSTVDFSWTRPSQKSTKSRDESFIEFTPEENSPDCEVLVPKEKVPAKTTVLVDTKVRKDHEDGNSSEVVHDDHRTVESSGSVTSDVDSISTEKVNSAVDVVLQTVISEGEIYEETATLDENRTREIVSQHGPGMISSIGLGSPMREIETNVSSSFDENTYTPNLPVPVSPTPTNGIQHSEDEDGTNIKVICSSNCTPVYIDDVTSDEQIVSVEDVKSTNPADDSGVKNQCETSAMPEIQHELYGNEIIDEISPLMSLKNLSTSGSSYIAATPESQRPVSRIGEACKIVVSQESRTFTAEEDSRSGNSTPSPKNQNKRVLESDENTDNLRIIPMKRKLLWYDAEDEENKENSRNLRHCTAKVKRTLLDYKENIENSGIRLIKSAKKRKPGHVKDDQDQNRLLKSKQTLLEREEDTKDSYSSGISPDNFEQECVKYDEVKKSPRNLRSRQEKTKLPALAFGKKKEDRNLGKSPTICKLLGLTNDGEGAISPRKLRNRQEKPGLTELDRKKDKENCIVRKSPTSCKLIGLTNNDKNDQSLRNLQNLPRKPKIAEVGREERNEDRNQGKSPVSCKLIKLRNDVKCEESPRNLRSRLEKSKPTESGREKEKDGHSLRKSPASCKLMGLANKNNNDKSPRNLRNRPRKPKVAELGCEKGKEDRSLGKSPASGKVVECAYDNSNDESPRNLRNRSRKPNAAELGPVESKEDHNLRKSPASCKRGERDVTNDQNIENSRGARNRQSKSKKTVLKCDEKENNPSSLGNNSEKSKLKNTEDEKNGENSCTSQTIPRHEDLKEGSCSLQNSPDTRGLKHVEDDKIKENTPESVSSQQKHYEKTCSLSDSPGKQERKSALKLSSKTSQETRSSWNMVNSRSQLQLYEISDSDNELDISKTTTSACKISENSSSPVRSMNVSSTEKTNDETPENVSSRNASQTLISDIHLDQNDANALTTVSQTDNKRCSLSESINPDKDTEGNDVLSQSSNKISLLGDKFYLDSDSDGSNVCDSQKSKSSSENKSTSSYPSVIHSDVENEKNAGPEKHHLAKGPIKLYTRSQIEVLLGSDSEPESVREFKSFGQKSPRSRFETTGVDNVNEGTHIPSPSISNVATPKRGTVPSQKQIHFSDSDESQLFAPGKTPSQNSYSHTNGAVSKKPVQKKKTKAETKLTRKLTDFLNHKICKDSQGTPVTSAKIQGSTPKGQSSYRKLHLNSVDDEIPVPSRKHQSQPKPIDTSPVKAALKLSPSIREEVFNSDNDSISNGFQKLSLESDGSAVLFSQDFQSATICENEAETTEGVISPDLLSALGPHNSLDEITFDHINEMIKNVPKPPKNGNGSSTEGTNSSDSYSGLPKNMKDSPALVKQSKKMRKRKERDILHKKHEISFISDSSDEDSAIFRERFHSPRGRRSQEIGKSTSPVDSKNKENVVGVEETNRQLNGAVVENSTSIHVSEIIIPPELCVTTKATAKGDQSLTAIPGTEEINGSNGISSQKLGFFTDDEYGSDELASNLDANLLQLGYYNDNMESNTLEEENERESVVSRDYDDDICRLREVMSEVAVLNEEQHEIDRSPGTVIATQNSLPHTASWEIDSMNTTNFSSPRSNSINTSSFKEMIWNSYPDSLETALTTAEEKLLEVREQMMKQFPELPVKIHRSSKDSDSEGTNFFDFE